MGIAALSMVMSQSRVQESDGRNNKECCCRS